MSAPLELFREQGAKRSEADQSEGVGGHHHALPVLAVLYHFDPAPFARFGSRDTFTVAEAVPSYPPRVQKPALAEF
ncbi:MAG TPA: hypothetical protein VLJ44_12205 [Gaiellaceae bacterium]|nr:hypothetical protein [Gaiellaceae bacterium]